MSDQVILRVVQDPDPIPPDEMTDGAILLAHYHTSFWREPKQLPFKGKQAYREWVRELEGDEGMQARWVHIPVQAYIHSGVHLSVAGDGVTCQWDTSYVGGVIIDKWAFCGGEHAPQDAHDWAAIARVFLEEWNTYLSGGVVGWEVVHVQTCNLGHEHETLLDSGWGFYDHEYCTREGEATRDWWAFKVANDGATTENPA